MGYSHKCIHKWILPQKVSTQSCGFPESLTILPKSIYFCLWYNFCLIWSDSTHIVILFFVLGLCGYCDAFPECISSGTVPSLCPMTSIMHKIINMFKKNKRKDERQQHKLIKMWEGSGFHLYAVTFPALSIKFFSSLLPLTGPIALRRLIYSFLKLTLTWWLLSHVQSSTTL